MKFSVFNPSATTLSVLSMLALLTAPTLSCRVAKDSGGGNTDSGTEDGGSSDGGSSDGGSSDGGTGDGGTEVDGDSDGSPAGEDCDDGDPLRYPGNPEVCDGVDNDCDELVDDGLLSEVWRDSDGDGFGDPAASTEVCEPTDGWVADDQDCDDGDPAVNPDAVEVCDGLDNDCDGGVDADAVDQAWYYADADGDGLGDPSGLVFGCEGATNGYDCDDGDATEPKVVDAAMGSAGGDGSLASPFSTIQSGINAANACVVVYPGTYAEAIDFGGHDLAVLGVEGPTDTIIDATGLTQPVVRFSGGETSAASLSGFTLSGGQGDLQSSSEASVCASTAVCTDYFETWCGGGLFVDSADPTLQDLWLTDNILPEAEYEAVGNDEFFTYSYGGGACFLNSAATLQGVFVADNFADQGGGFYLDEETSITMVQSALYANQATDAGGVMVDGGTFALTAGIFAWNAATEDGGGLLVIDGSSTLINVTVAGGSASSGGGVMYSGSTTNTLLNSIVAYNLADGVLRGVGSSTTIQYSNVYGNGDDWGGGASLEGSSGNISGDPAFTAWTDDGDWSNDDLSLGSSSASIDAGNAAASYYDVDGSRNDQGAYGGPGGGW